ncbi:MAG TPA: YceI family protein [Solirubrobacteraceae bacterium]|jgi:polyisoprenoid-binding protein YceI|nr:YceI family protein [Solirubrobacteraceae bacterium]
MSTIAVGVLPETGLWEVNGRHSTMRFSVRHHAVASFRASFYPLSGRYDAATRTLSGEVRLDDLQVPIEALRTHTLSPAFFDAEGNPTIAFTSEQITTEGGVLVVNGRLTMRGVTKPLVARGSLTGPSEVPHQNDPPTEHLGIDLAATIDRREFGVDFNNEITGGRLNLGWEVAVDVALELIRSAGQ